ncbi:hypothetical protein GE21DRAFT_2211 [Neurospora crassa]|uniref:Uncharacterized protein n=1 Tax=Neurospora crassa (strain ATCC 24698 / 74-OR23-1A / CBS 708.71 / DSM 1257 / FGSC 987) TaxID=367110 RepID=Q7SDL9_NEUCR|nr:hypothetical protein NCU00525 [Neurospora crassa OR74A]EAA34841.1 hypothetical protein NCU00525 [Neurospora crassa OR74A]KHE85106.1 hypothetical protein GE21DRAFT_2211 [Neurospora crassa]|eukprot:XP_964077.1 hypothetical protein NCU00525 [Neurospora crassa OR74A]
MRRLNTGEHAPVWEEENEDMHDRSSRPLLTEGLQKQKKQPTTTKLGPTLPNGETRKRKRVTFAVPAPIPTEIDQDHLHMMSIIDKLAEAEPRKRPGLNPITAVVPVSGVSYITKTDPRKPMLLSEFSMNEPSNSRNRMLSDLIRTLDSKKGRRTRNRSEHWQLPAPEQQEEVDAATSMRDMQENQQTSEQGSSLASTEHEEENTKPIFTNDPEDSEDKPRHKWLKIPAQIWRNTTVFLANTVDHLPFYTSLKEKQWQAATRMWEEEAKSKRMSVPSTKRKAENSHHTPWLHCDRL